MNDSDDNEEFIENVTFDELRIGQSARLSRALSQQDIAAFAAVFGDINPAAPMPRPRAPHPATGSGEKKAGFLESRLSRRNKRITAGRAAIPLRR